MAYVVISVSFGLLSAWFLNIFRVIQIEEFKNEVFGILFKNSLPIKSLISNFFTELFFIIFFFIKF